MPANKWASPMRTGPLALQLLLAALLAVQVFEVARGRPGLFARSDYLFDQAKPTTELITNVSACLGSVPVRFFHENAGCSFVASRRSVTTQFGPALTRSQKIW
jgi:hypothetical protein